jgi:hypothetical protein
MPLPELLLYAHCLALQTLGRTALGRVLAQQITVNPKPTLPGSNLPQIIINGVAYIGIGASLLGLLIGGASWGLGSVTANYGRADFGKRMTFYSVCGGLIIGAAAALINFAVGLGQHASPGSFG